MKQMSSITEMAGTRLQTSAGYVPALTSLALATLFFITSCSTTAHSDVFEMTEVAKFEKPWAMAFLPDGRLLITERRGDLLLLSADGTPDTVSGVPAVNFGGQGGLGDVVLHPAFDDNQLVYFSYAEAGDGGSGAVVARGRLQLDRSPAELTDVEIIWRQYPKVSGQGHYGHRIAFGPDGYLYISSGERQKFDPAQDMQGNLGKVVRLNDDGTVPLDNPFADDGGVTAQIWSLGHRNPLGLAFDNAGQLWVLEMGPQHGDELNLVEKGANYGYPIVSNGDHYDGTKIPDHDTRPEFKAPAVTWIPAISPSSLLFYNGDEFPQWRGSAFIGGLSSSALIRVTTDGANASEVERFPMPERIRAVAEGPDGALWLLQDGKSDDAGRLVRLTRPATP